MSMVKNKKLSRFIVAVLAVMTILAYSVPASVLAAPWENTSQVNYSEDSSTAESRWPKKYAGNDTKTVTVFCVNANKNASPTYNNKRFFLEQDAVDKDGVNYLAYVCSVNEPNPIPANQHEKVIKLLKKVLGYGYLGNDPKNLFPGFSDGKLYEVTQAAVYQITHYGNLDSSELPQAMSASNVNPTHASEADVKKLLDVVFDDNAPTPEGELYVFAALSNVDGRMVVNDGQSLVGGELTVQAEPTEPKHPVKISKKILGGDELEGARMVVKKGDTVVEQWTSTNTTTEITLEAGNYVMTETVAPKGYKQVTTEIKFSVGNDGKVSLETTSVNNGGKINITGNHIVLENAPENTPNNDENNDKGKLSTTVSAGDKTASAAAAISLTADEAAEITSITDKIDYEGLVGGATYNVQGTLMDVTNASNPTAVATSEAKDFKAVASGKGTWQIEFKNVQLETGRKFVVFEKATLVKDADGNEIPENDRPEPLEHNDVNDKAQTIIVGQDEEYTSNLSATKTTDTKTATVGDVIPYTITITNDGNADAKDVKVTDVIGEYLKYVSDDSKGNNVGQNVNWTVDVPAGSSIEIAIDCEVTEGATGKLINKVLIIDSTNPDNIQEYEDNATVAFAPPEDEDDGSDSSKKGDAASQSKKSLAATSDEFNLGLWAILATISGLALAAGALRRRYER